jgi:enoyl-CoA hydratase/carnithine racemase
MSDEVLYRVEDGVAVITLNRPDRLNAWTPPLQERYFDALAEADGSAEVGAIVVTGAGRGFCPGADMAYLQDLGASGGERPAGSGRPMTFPLTTGKPTIAAINGACAGLGLVQALMCDLRFAAAGAKFTTAFSRRGLIAEHGASWLLPRLVGTANALDLLLSARVFTSDEALALGMVNRVLAPEDLLPEALAYARDVAANCSPAAMAIIKRQVYRHATTDLETARTESNRLMAASLAGPDFKEGVASYVDKRPPAFAPLGEGTTFPDSWD